MSTRSILELHDLTVVYGHGRHALRAVDGLSLGVPAGGTLGLVGESGSGKSTVARAIMGLTKIADGRIFLDGEEKTTDRARRSAAFRRRVQMVFQDPYSSLNPRMSVGEMLGEALGRRQGSISRSDRHIESARLLDLVGLRADALDRYPHEFSGGQRQRLAVARALAVQPDVVLLDEVTSALDVSVQSSILNLLLDLQRELRLSYLFISHDLAVVRLMSTQAAVMYLGQVAESAPTEELFQNPRHPYTRALMASIPKISRRAAPVPIAGEVPDPRNPPTGCRFHTRCPIGPQVQTTRIICRERDPHESPKDGGSVACFFPLEKDAVLGEDGVLRVDAPQPGSVCSRG